MVFIFSRIHRLCLSGLLAVGLTGPSVFALENTKNSSVHEVGLVVPWRHFDSVLRAEFPSDRMHNYDFNDLSFVAQDVPFVIPKTNLSVLFHMQPGVFKNLSGAWDMSSLVIKIQTSPFKVEKTIVENVGGVILSVKLNASCSGITLLQQSASARIGVELSTNGSDVQSQVNEMAFRWNEQWWVDEIVCEGPRGFGELISKELRLKLADPAVVEGLVKETLQSQMQKEIQAIVTKAMIPQLIYSEGSQQIALKYKKIESVNSVGLLVVADLNISTPVVGLENTVSTMTPLALSPGDLSVIHDKPVLFLPQAAFLASTRAALTSYVFKGDLIDFKSFKSLMKSRFTQFFVWPDLRKYPKDSKFPFQARMQTLNNVSFDKGLKMNLNGVIESWLQSTRATQRWNYLYTKSTLSTEVEISVVNGELKLTLKETKLKSKAQMYPEYVMRFKPSKSIATSIIDSALKGSVLSKGLSVALPIFKVNASAYKATSVVRSSPENLAVEF
jgi:hypothetical protein